MDTEPSLHSPMLTNTTTWGNDVQQVLLQRKEEPKTRYHICLLLILSSCPFEHGRQSPTGSLAPLALASCHWNKTYSSPCLEVSLILSSYSQSEGKSVDNIINNIIVDNKIDASLPNLSIEFVIVRVMNILHVKHLWLEPSFCSGLLQDQRVGTSL